MSRSPSRRPAGDAGFVQIAVLGSLTIIAAIMTAAMAMALSANKASAALERVVEHDAATRAGLVRLISALGDPADTIETDAFAGGVTMDLSGIAVHLRIESEASKLGLMLSDMDLLVRYARNAGASTAAIDELRRALQDARSTQDKDAAQQAMLLALRGLRSRQELMTDVTAYAETSGIDPAYATASVLAALPDLTSAQVAMLLATPPSERAGRVQSRYFGGSPRRFSLLAAVVEPGGQLDERRMIVELSAAGVAIPLSGMF